jgi:hypothetical protein
MKVAVLGPNYCDFQLCTIVDGLQSLGHTVEDFGLKGLNYMEPAIYGAAGPNAKDYDFIIVADTNNVGACMLAVEIPKVILHGHDRWTDYINVPNSPVKQILYPGWKCDIAFVRDLDRKQFLYTDYPIYPMEFSVERRFVEACMEEWYFVRGAFKYLPWMDRKFDVAFFGTRTTARRDLVLAALENRFKCSFGDAHAFTIPDNYWSKWVNGRYTHAPMYYKALSNSVFALSPLGAGPSCGRTYEGYAAGCIPLIQRYPKEIEQIVPFVDGENCILWDSVEELVEKIADYKSRPDDLGALQLKCIDFATENLLSKHRAQFILDKMKEHGLL